MLEKDRFVPVERGEAPLEPPGPLKAGQKLPASVIHAPSTDIVCYPDTKYLSVYNELEVAGPVFW